jgi:serine protease DegQ
MRARWSLCLLALFPLALPLHAGEAAKAATRTYRVPYRLTDTNHILVRAKINGKGPFNFIVDTGAPALFVATAVCRKAGVKADAKGWGTFDKFEIEGGLVIPKARGRIEDPFQLEGMNGMGLAGVQLHGMIGYNLLAKYRLEIDFTKDKMGWTPLDFKPPPPVGLGGKGGANVELEALGAVMKVMGFLMGKSATPEIAFRGFLGIELTDTRGGVHVKGVLAQGPAAVAGLKAGDRITRFQGKGIKSSTDVQRLAARLKPGATVRVTVARDRTSREISFKIGEGL